MALKIVFEGIAISEMMCGGLFAYRENPFLVVDTQGVYSTKETFSEDFPFIICSGGEEKRISFWLKHKQPDWNSNESILQFVRILENAGINSLAFLEDDTPGAAF